MTVHAKRNVQLIVGTMVMLCTGAIYAWSVFVPALQEAFGWDASQTSLVFTFTLIFDAAVFLGAIVLLYLAGLTHSVPIMAASFMVLGLSYGGIASSNAAYILGTFGPANYGSNFGAFNLANMFASPISQVIGGSMAVRLGSYTATFPILVGVAGAGLALSLLLKEHVDAPR